MAEKVARVYAAAAFEAAATDRDKERLVSDARTLSQMLEAEPRLMKIFLHPDISAGEKKQSAEKIFKGRLSDTVCGLIAVLIEKDRMSCIGDVLGEIEALYKKYKGIGVVYVSAAMPVNDRQKAALEKKLLETTGCKSLEMHYSVDESLIAGITVRMGDRMVDSSVKTRLTNMKRQLQTLQLK